MNPANGRLLPAVLLLVGAWTGLALAAGSPKIDMRDYYAPSTLGSTTGWEYADGATATATVQSVDTDESGKSVTTRLDASDGSWLETELVYREGGTHYGTITSVVAGGAGVILPARSGFPVRLQPRMQRVGRTYRSRVIRGDVIDVPTGLRTGRFVRRETVTLGGFEDKTTPAEFYGGALRQDWTADTRYFFTDRSTLRVSGSGTYWWALGQGVVAQRARVLLYHNGVLDSDSGMEDGWRVSVTAPAGGLFDLAVFSEAR
jgi:hypothetical protein